MVVFEPEPDRTGEKAFTAHDRILGCAGHVMQEGHGRSFSPKSELGVISYVGEDAAATGRKAAELHLAKGAKSGLCVNHVPGNPGTEARCSGFKAGMEAGGGRAKVLSLPYSSQRNPQQISRWRSPSGAASACSTAF